MRSALVAVAALLLVPAANSAPPVNTWGGEWQTASGPVELYVTNKKPRDDAYARHAGELEAVRFVLLLNADVWDSCNAPDDDVRGCYSTPDKTIVGPTEDYPNATMASILAHEFGHHIAHHRSNAPWPAAHYGPKRWATNQRICPRVKAGSLIPGDNIQPYETDPGEAWAETYALAVLRSTPWEWWLDPSLKPNEATYQAALLDATQPWVPRSRTWQGRVTKRTAAKLALTTLDGRVNVTLASAPRGATVSLYAGTRRVAGPARRLNYTACGSGRLSVRVTSPRSGAYSVSLTYP